MLNEHCDAPLSNNGEYWRGGLFDAARSLCPAVLFRGGGGSKEHTNGKRVKIITRGISPFGSNIPTYSELRNRKRFLRIPELACVSLQKDRKRIIRKIRERIPGPIYMSEGFFMEKNRYWRYRYRIIVRCLRENGLVFQREKKR